MESPEVLAPTEVEISESKEHIATAENKSESKSDLVQVTEPGLQESDTSQVSTESALSEELIDNKDENKTKSKNVNIKRSTSLRNERSLNEKNIQKSTTTTSIADSKNPSSIICSPPTNRKVRPPVLRNFQLSKFTGQAEEQKSKYLPPPRMRRTSDESLKTKKAAEEPSTKPVKPARKKGKRKSLHEEDLLKSQKDKDNKDSTSKLSTFEFKFIGSKTQVQVVGNFNSWIPENLYFNNNGVWSKHIELSSGTYHFRFVNTNYN